jgi:hypothetical protein
MDGARFSYVGIAAAVAGVVGMFGVYSAWWETDAAIYHGTADRSGALAIAMSFALFAFGGASILLSDPTIRRALGALVSLCSVLLVFACIWGVQRADQVASGATVSTGLWVTFLGGIVGIAAGLLSIRDAQRADAGTHESGPPDPLAPPGR